MSVTESSKAYTNQPTSPHQGHKNHTPVAGLTVEVRQQNSATEDAYSQEYTEQYYAVLLDDKGLISQSPLFESTSAASLAGFALLDEHKSLLKRNSHFYGCQQVPF